MPNQNPLLGKNLPLFLRKNLRGNKIALCQALGASPECLSRLAKRWCYVGLCRWHLRMLHAAYVRVNALIAPLVVGSLDYRCLYRRSLPAEDCILRQHRSMKLVPIVEIV